MARIMSRYGWVAVPGTFVAVNLFTVPAGQKLELIEVWWQTNGVAGVNAAIANNDLVTGISFVDHIPAIPAGPAVIHQDLGNFVCRPGSVLQAYQLSAGPVNCCVTAILVDL